MTWTDGFKRWSIGALAATSLCVSAVPARAQTALNLSLDEAIRRAREHAPRLAEAAAREAAARSTFEARRAIAFPSASVAGGYTRTNHVDEISIPQPGGGTRVLFPDIPDNYRIRGELSVPVYAFGRVGASLDAARLDAESAAQSLRALESDVRLDVTRAFWWLVTAREAVAVMERGLARADASVADVRARVDTGVLPPNELLTAQAQRARQSVRLIQARNDAALAELDLARLIGEPAGTRIAPASSLDQSLLTGDYSVGRADDLVAQAHRARPEGAVLTAQRDSIRASARAVLANLRPYIAGLATVEPARPNVRFVPPTDRWRTSWSLGVSVTWPLFDSGRSRAEGAALDAQARVIEAKHQEFNDAVSMEVRRGLLDLAASLAAIAASDDAVAAATEAHRVVGERFRAGVATSTEVLDAEVALLEAELEGTRLRASLRVSEARVQRAVGGQ